MKRILLLLGLVLLLWCDKAQAISCNQSHVFVTGETLTAAVLNANPANFVTCFGLIDNTNIGPNGIFASQIIPTTVGQATFGGSTVYVFNNGLTVNGTFILNGTVIVGSNLAFNNINNNFTTQQSITTTNSFFVLSGGGTSGVEASAGILDLVGVPGSGGTGLALDTEQASPGNLVVFQKQGVTVASVGSTGLLTGVGVTAGTGTVKGASDGSTNTYVPPAYTNTGSAVASTFHMVFISCSGTSSSPCTVTLSGAAAFSSSTSFACGASPVVATGGTSNAYIISSTSVALQTNIGTSTTLTAICAGT